jgi:hypothetical protein
MDSRENVLDDLFHGCALAAFVEQACRAGGWPESETVRQRAYDLYEQSLSERSRRPDRQQCHETVTQEACEIR